MKGLLGGLVVLLVGGVAVLWYDSTQTEPIQAQIPAAGGQGRAGGSQLPAGPGIWFRSFSYDGATKTWYENFGDGSRVPLAGPPP